MGGEQGSSPAALGVTGILRLSLRTAALPPHKTFLVAYYMRRTPRGASHFYIRLTFIHLGVYFAQTLDARIPRAKPRRVWRARTELPARVTRRMNHASTP